MKLYVELGMIKKKKSFRQVLILITSNGSVYGDSFSAHRDGDEVPKIKREYGMKSPPYRLNLRIYMIIIVVKITGFDFHHVLLLFFQIILY